jgi:hypothetical protein
MTHRTLGKEPASAVDVDCASFCLGYIVGAGARGGDDAKKPRGYGAICRNFSIVVAQYGNSPSLSIEEYDKRLLQRAYKDCTELGATTLKESILVPFLERAARRDGTNPWESAVSHLLVRNEATFKNKLRVIIFR